MVVVFDFVFDLEKQVGLDGLWIQVFVLYLVCDCIYQEEGYSCDDEQVGEIIDFLWLDFDKEEIVVVVFYID